MAQKILEQPREVSMEAQGFVGRIGNGFGKPDLLSINFDAKHLHELVSPASWRFFDIFGVPHDFLYLSPEHWHMDNDYNEAMAYFKVMKVTNESAERSVKLCSDFLGLSKKEDVFQNYLQVIEEERKKTPDIRKAMKRKLNKK